MLKGKLLHPQIMHALGSAGHGSRILVADGNYPFSTRHGPNAQMVYLNLAPGLVAVTDVLAALVQMVEIEAAAVMQPAKTGPYALKSDPDIFADFARILEENVARKPHLPLQRLERFKFYQEASSADVCLTIATGEQRIYANLLLTIGVVRSVN